MKLEKKRDQSKPSCIMYVYHQNMIVAACMTRRERSLLDHARHVGILLVSVSFVLVLIHVEDLDLPAITHADTPYPPARTAIQGYADLLAFNDRRGGTEQPASCKGRGKLSAHQPPTLSSG